MSATLAHSTASPLLDGVVCTACGTPLGPAARYCVDCGARQGGARTELLDLVPAPSTPPGSVASTAPTAVLPAVSPGSAPAAAPPAAPPVAPASVATLAAVGPRTWPFAVTAVVLVALVVGLGLGRLLADGRGGAGGPQVIRIEGGGGAAVAPSAADAPAGDVAPPAAEGAVPDPAPTPAPAASGGAE